MKSMTLELGARRSWRHYGEGRWVRTKNESGERVFKHEPAKHEITVPNATADGLLQADKDWRRANDLQQVEGDIRRMIRVSNVKDAGDDPPTGITPVMAVVDRVVGQLGAMLKLYFGNPDKK